MDEKEYIYSRLKYLNDQVIYLSQHINELINGQEKLLKLITLQGKLIDKIASPDYIKKVNKHNETMDVIDKINFIRNELNKK